MITLDAFLSTYITPELQPLGFKKTRRTYRLVADNGDQVLVEAQKSDSPPDGGVSFYINIAVVPKPYFEVAAFIFERRFGRKYQEVPSTEGGLVSDRLASDPAVAYPSSGRFTDKRWYFRDEESAKLCAEHLVGKLTTYAIPVLTQLLDRKRLRAYVAEADRGVPFRALTGARVDIALLIDEGFSPELDAALERVRSGRDSAAAEWAEARLKQAQGSGGAS